jgi:hypothetical protein
VEEMPIADLHAKSGSYLAITVSDPDKAVALLAETLGIADLAGLD